MRNNYLNALTSAFYLLIIWTAIGFQFKLDNSQDFGCTLIETGVIYTKNVVYCTISLTLLIVGFLTRNQEYKLVLFTGETLLWLIKLFYIKGGYSVGLSLTPLSGIVLFDLFGLALRLFMLKELFNLSLKSAYIFVPVYIIMVIKTHSLFLDLIPNR